MQERGHRVKPENEKGAHGSVDRSWEPSFPPTANLRGLQPNANGSSFNRGAGCESFLQCKKRGSCVHGRCNCDFGYFGEACEGECPGGAHSPCNLRGRCEPLTGKCTCLSGYAGSECHMECPGGHENACNGRGKCLSETGICDCDEGYSGSACQNKALRSSGLNLECPALSSPFVVREGVAQPAYSSVSGAYEIAAKLKDISTLHCLWWTSKPSPLDYTLLHASSQPSVATISLAMDSSGVLTHQGSRADIVMPCLNEGETQFWIQIVFPEHDIALVELFFVKECHNTSKFRAQTCKGGFWGKDCTRQCPGGSTVPCSGHGRCDSKDGSCSCHPGFRGSACEVSFEVSCPNNCSAHGVCSPLGTCHCFDDWRGESCNERLCLCSGHGSCKHGHICFCAEGWAGESCSISTRGKEVKTCPSDCNGRGACDTLIGLCRCPDRYVGPDCSEGNHVFCPNHCSGHGRCSSDGLCYCMKEYTGNDCSNFLPFDEIYIREQIDKFRYNESSRAGSSLQKSQECPNKCSGHGSCSHGKEGRKFCFCLKGFQGVDCSLAVPSNPFPFSQLRQPERGSPAPVSGPSRTITTSPTNASVHVGVQQIASANERHEEYQRKSSTGKQTFDMARLRARRHAPESSLPAFEWLQLVTWLLLLAIAFLFFFGPKKASLRNQTQPSTRQSSKTVSKVYHAQP